MTCTLFTIGHSTHDLDSFIQLLKGAGIECLVDIRTVPRSRTNPQFNRDTLPAALAAVGIDYVYQQHLGGLRGKSKTIPPEINGFWENDSFHHYADYALTDEFRQALDALLTRAQNQRCAIMCAEAVWWRCHRRIVADHAMARGVSVFHIMDKGHLQAAKLTQGAQICEDGRVVYPPTDAVRIH